MAGNWGLVWGDGESAEMRINQKSHKGIIVFLAIATLPLTSIASEPVSFTHNQKIIIGGNELIIPIPAGFIEKEIASNATGLKLSYHKSTDDNEGKLIYSLSIVAADEGNFTQNEFWRDTAEIARIAKDNPKIYFNILRLSSGVPGESLGVKFLDRTDNSLTIYNLSFFPINDVNMFCYTINSFLHVKSKILTLSYSIVSKEPVKKLAQVVADDMKSWCDSILAANVAKEIVSSKSPLEVISYGSIGIFIPYPQDMGITNEFTSENTKVAFRAIGRSILNDAIFSAETIRNAGPITPAALTDWCKNVFEKVKETALDARIILNKHNAFLYLYSEKVDNRTSHMISGLLRVNGYPVLVMAGFREKNPNIEKDFIEWCNAILTANKE